MSRPPSGEDPICPNCHQPVDRTKPNAMLSAATDLWQHKDCWRVSAPIVAPESTTSNPRRTPPSR